MIIIRLDITPTANDDGYAEIDGLVVQLSIYRAKLNYDLGKIWVS